MTAKHHHSPADKPLAFLRKKRLFVVSAAFVIVLLGAITAQAFYYQNRMGPRTVVAGVDVGGKSLTEAQAAVTAKIKPWLDGTTSYTYKTQEWKIANASLGLATDAQTLTKKAYQDDKQGSVFNRIGRQLEAWVHPRKYAVTVQPLTDEAQKKLVDTILKKIETPFQETSLSFAPGNVKVVPGIPGAVFNYDSFYRQQSAMLNDGAAARVALELKPSYPEVKPEQAEAARKQAADMLDGPWTLHLGGMDTEVSAGTLAGWLDSPVARDAHGAATGLQLALKEDKVQAFIKNQAKPLDKKPVNAVLSVNDSGALQVATEGVSGFQVKQAETLAAMKQTLLAERPAGAAKEIQGITEVVPADVRSDTIESLGLKEKIGTATTDFAGSSQNRIHNIDTGTKALSGQLVKDGETFSTTGTLGDVDETTGYVPELVILNNRTVPEYGGGLCQVSTTLFRSVLNAGLPIVERSNHAYRVGYYERSVGPGLDATVYIPKPDFRWKNDTGHAVYIIGHLKDKTVTFDLYGTKDGRSSTISAPKILEEMPAGDPIIAYSDSMYKDEKKQLETPHAGAKTLVTYDVARDGKNIYHLDIYSTYKPWPAQYLVGTKERPAATPAPAASPSPSPGA